MVYMSFTVFQPIFEITFHQNDLFLSETLSCYIPLNNTDHWVGL